VKAGAYILTPVSVSYDPSSNRLRTLFEYYENLDGQSFTISLSFSQLGSIFQNVVPFSVALPKYTQNNLSLYAFSEKHYIVALAAKYISFSIAALSLILFVAGYFGAKLTAIECLGVVQVSALLLLTLKNMSPSFG
jgi:hypothetical protein